MIHSGRERSGPSKVVGFVMMTAVIKELKPGGFMAVDKEREGI